MSFIKWMTEGAWWIRSKKDPRWNANGVTSVGMGTMPDVAVEKLKELDGRLGERPDDLEWGYHKY